MQRAHKIQLDPTAKQAGYFACACGVSRFTWNWALSEWKRQYEAGEKPSGLGLKKQFNAIRRQLTYKAESSGSRVVVADRWYPSSKTCSDCGFKLDMMPLSIREWVCPGCGCVHDRDLNAAVNLKQLGQAMSEVTPVEREALARTRVRVKPLSAKQEPTGTHLCVPGR